MDLYINETTRTLAICSNNYALVLMDNINSRDHNSITSSSESSSPKCLIEFVPQNSVPLNTFRKIQKEIFGFLGLICLKGTIYVGFITGKSNVGALVPEINVHQLINTMFVNFNGEVFSSSNQLNHTSYTHQSIQQLQHLEESYETLESSSPTSRITSVMKLLETGTFYYSYDTDLAVKAQDWDTGNKSDYSYTTVQNLQDDYPGRFVWNNNLISELSTFRGRLSNEERQIFDKGKFYITLIRGFVQREIFESSSTGWMTIISRQDSRKIGPLFGPACIDEEGNVANFVETEVIVYTSDYLVSYTLVKGNVPLFWKLDSHLLSTKIEFPRSQDASNHAFNRFFETMCAEYNMIFILDALSTKGSQPELSERYANAVQELQNDHKELSVCYKKLTHNGIIGNRLKGKNDYISLLLQDDQVHTALANYSAYQFNFKEWRQTARQLGTFVVNTLDSNDRANHIECKLSEMILEYIFGTNFTAEIWSKHNVLWVSNGTALGRLSDTYNASIKTKNKTGGLIGKFAEQSKKYAEQSKKYVAGNANTNGSSSSGRQTQFDKLLGRKNKEVQVELIDPIHDYVLQGLNKRRSEFTTMKNLEIYAVTFNVNAVLYEDDIADLIFPEKDTFNKYDLIAIALEEVIELTPSKVMSIDSRTRNFWEKKFKEALNSKNAKEYTLLRGEQLGGVLLLIYSGSETIDNIKNVETSVKKTGFKGISANKGGVAITFTFSTHSRICFVASHLAAGQSNSEERHQNYKTIVNGLVFKRCKSIKDADILIWMGDLNYRISLPNELVRKMLHYKPPNYILHRTSSTTNNNNLSYESFVSDETYPSSPDMDATSILEDVGANSSNDKGKYFQEQEDRIELENEYDLESKMQREQESKLILDGEYNNLAMQNDIYLNNKHVDSRTSLNFNQLHVKDNTSQTYKRGLSSSSLELNNQISNNDNDISKMDPITHENNSQSFYGSNNEKSTDSHIHLCGNGEEKVISQLYEYDQLNYQMANGQSFPFFDEMEIKFKPTYKFDKGTDYYDTSEKQRVPSWTDRILTHTKNKRVTSLEQLRYNSIPKFKFSDHKPVYGIFVATLEIVNDSTRSTIEKELYDKTKQKLYSKENGGGVLSAEFLISLLAESRFHKVLKRGLPPPSSKTSRWWISKDTDGSINDEKLGKVKVNFPELDGGEFMINPNIPRNPFVKNEESLFIPKDLS